MTSEKTYLVQGSEEKLKSLCFDLFLKILLNPQSIHQLNSDDSQLLMKLNPDCSVIEIRKVCPVAILPVF